MRKAIVILLLASAGALACRAQPTGNCSNQTSQQQQRSCADSQKTSTSGTVLTVQNNGGLVPSFEYLITGSPATVSIVIQGCGPGGTCDTLDTYTTVSNSVRAPTVSKFYNYYTITPSWTGGTSPAVQVNTTITSARTLPTSLPPSGAAGGDLSGTFPNPTVAKINGAAVPASMTCVQSNGASQLTSGGPACYGVMLGSTGYYAFGDSITFGSYADNLFGYASMFAAATASPFNNYGVSGDAAADMVWHLFTDYNPQDTQDPFTTGDIGTNDQFQALPTDLLTTTVQSMAAWASIPQSAKVFGQSAACVQTGTWSNDSQLTAGAALGVNSTTNASTLTCTIATGGGPIYVWYKQTISNGGTMTVAIDGGSTTTLTGSIADWTVATGNGQSSTIGLARLTGIAAGSHSVVFTVTSSTSGSNINTVYAVGTPPGTATGEVYQPTGPNWFEIGLNDWLTSPGLSPVSTATTDNLIKTQIALLAGDGLRVSYIPVACARVSSGSPCVSTSQLNNNNPAGGYIVHPNTIGHQNMRDAIIQVLHPATTPLSGGLNIVTNQVSSVPQANFYQQAPLIADGTANLGSTQSVATQYVAIKFTCCNSPSAQPFNGNIGAFTVRLNGNVAFTNPGSHMLGSIYSDNSGVPGTIIQGAQQLLYGQVGTSATAYYFGEHATLVSGTNYWIVLNFVQTPTGATMSVGGAASGTAQYATSSNGTSWATVNNFSGYYGIFGQTNFGVVGQVDTGGCPSCGVTATAGVKGISTTSYGGIFTSQYGDGLQASSLYQNGIDAITSYGTALAATAAASGTAVNANNSGTGLGLNVSSSGYIAAAIGTTSGNSTLTLTNAGTLSSASSAPMVSLSRTLGTGGHNITGPLQHWVENGADGAGDYTAGITFDLVGFGTTRIQWEPFHSDGASTVGYMFDTGVSWANAAAELLSLRNNGTEKLGVFANGTVSTPGVLSTGKYVASGQTSATTAQTLVTTSATSTYQINAIVTCDTSVAAATVTLTIAYTDPSSTSQSISPSAAVCTTLGSASIASITQTIRAKTGTTITAAAAIVGSPNYDIAATALQVTSN